MDLENVDDEPGHGGNVIIRFGLTAAHPDIVPIQVNHEEDEPEMASDEDEFLLDNGNFGHDGIFSVGHTFLNATNVRDAGGLFVHRRQRHNGTSSLMI